MLTVFLSSVAQGLEPYRDAVYKAIEGLDAFHCVRMEDFGASDKSPHSLCIDKLRECDIFVGIVGHRYGSIDPKTGKSFTESEYEAAVESGVPASMHLAPEEFSVPANMIEPDELREKQANFRARIRQERVVTFFLEGDGEMLARQVVQAIHNLHSEAVKKGALVQEPTITKLMFPFATNVAGFDTGFAVSNISGGLFGGEAQEGTCTIHYVGYIFGSDHPPKPQTSSVIRAGEQLVFNLSSGGGHSVLNTPGFQGYLIVECRFKAAGFAFVSDIGVQRVGAGYLAQILE